MMKEKVLAVKDTYDTCVAPSKLRIYERNIIMIKIRLSLCLMMVLTFVFSSFALAATSSSFELDSVIATNFMQELFISALDPARIQNGQNINNLADSPGTYLFRRIIEFNEVTDKIIGTEKEITSTPEVTIESMTRQNNGALLIIRVYYTFVYVRDNVDSSCGLYYEAFMEHDSDGKFIVTSLIPLAPEYENLIHMSEEMINEHFSRFDAESFARDYNKKMSMNHLYDFINFTAATQIPLYLPLYAILITQILTQYI